MKKLFLILLSAVSLTAFAQDTEKSPLPKWFMKPAAHTYVGICVPNGDVQEAINVALLHYLICHELSGKIDRHISEMSNGEKTTTNMQSLLELDTTIQYSIEELVSTPYGEYICRISDRPTLSRRIHLTYLMTYHEEYNGESAISEIEETFRCYYTDETGKSVMSFSRKQEYGTEGDGNYAYSSQYMHENGVSKNYSNNKIQTSLGEQLMGLYMNRLEGDFIGLDQKGGAMAESAMNAHHKANPIKEFEFINGQIIIGL